MRDAKRVLCSERIAPRSPCNTEGITGARASSGPRLTRAGGLATLALLISAGTGCFWAPGWHLDEPAIHQGRSSTAEQGLEFQFVPITAELVTEQYEAARERAAERDDREALDARASEVEGYEYRVGPHDVLSVIVWDHPELTIPAGEFRSAEATGHPVNADGTFFYPYAGVLKVGGKTLPEIRQLLTEKLSKKLRDPQLDLRVAAFRSQKVHVTGELKMPATLPISDVPMRALEAINRGQGTTDEADLSRVTLTRDGVAHRLDLQALNEQGDLTQNWLLRDGDVLHVPDRSHNKVFVLGEVQRPATQLMMKGRMTLAEALGNGEGLNKTGADPGRIYVFRAGRTEGEQAAVFKLDASSPDALLLAVQFPLQPLDVVFVSATELTRYSRTMAQIIPTVQALWQSFDLSTRGVRSLFVAP